MIPLTTNLAGIEFPNPFILASGPPSANGTMIKKAFDKGWGGAVIKTVALEPTPLAKPRVHILSKGRQQTGMVNIELLTDISIDQWKRELDYIRSHHPDRPIIVSIMGGGNPDDWQLAIHALEGHGVTAYELNVSCPNISGKKGAQLGQDPDSVAMVTRWAKEVTKLPVFVKLTPNVTDIVPLAKIVADAGGDGITATNTLSGLAGIDVETFSPLPSVEGVGSLGGYSGHGLKPVSLRCVVNIARAVDIPIFGCGGVETWQDAVEYLLVGASAVQLCSAVMWRGTDLIEQLTSGLERYLEDHQFDSIAALCRKALPKLVNYSELDFTNRLKAVIDPAKCNGCGLCIKACDGGGYQAINMNDLRGVILDERCDGCGLCVGICPTRAIVMSVPV
jgi:dihydropyrimidine dehydrogenase (NAD+) subunit PreA